MDCPPGLESGRCGEPVAVSRTSTEFGHPASSSFIISITSKLSCPSHVSLDFNQIVEGSDRQRGC